MALTEAPAAADPAVIRDLQIQDPQEVPPLVAILAVVVVVLNWQTKMVPVPSEQYELFGGQKEHSLQQTQAICKNAKEITIICH
jgi:hypothetical protein